MTFIEVHIDNPSDLITLFESRAHLPEILPPLIIDDEKGEEEKAEIHIFAQLSPMSPDVTYHLRCLASDEYIAKLEAMGFKTLEGVLEGIISYAR